MTLNISYLSSLKIFNFLEKLTCYWDLLLGLSPDLGCDLDGSGDGWGGGACGEKERDAMCCKLRLIQLYVFALLIKESSRLFLNCT